MAITYHVPAGLPTCPFPPHLPECPAAGRHAASPGSGPALRRAGIDRTLAHRRGDTCGPTKQCSWGKANATWQCSEVGSGSTHARLSSGGVQASLLARLANRRCVQEGQAFFGVPHQNTVEEAGVVAPAGARAGASLLVAGGGVNCDGLLLTSLRKCIFLGPGKQCV